MIAALKNSALFILISVVLTSSAFAYENIRVSVPRLVVYSQPSTTSPVLATFTQGQVIQVWGNPSSQFRMVYATDVTGARKIGYVALGGSAQRVARPQGAGGGRGLQRHWSLGLMLGGAYSTQSTRTITDANNNMAVTGVITGTVPEFGLELLLPWKSNLLEFYVASKTSTLAGSYTLNTTTGTITLTQAFISAGALGRFYFGRSFWAGPGVQLDYGTSASIQLVNENFSISTNQFIYLFATGGYDIGISDNFFVVPSLRIGADVNASPVMIEADVVANLTYRF